MILRLERILVRVLLVAGVVGLALFARVGVSWYDTRGEDIFYEWLRARALVAGENPYERILDVGTRDADARLLATYFPLFYLLTALTHLAGLRDYDRWVSFWRFVFALAGIGTGALLFYAFYQRRRVLVGLLAAAFWLLSRWTLHVALIAHIELLPIFFLVLSLLLFRRHHLLSLVLFGVSLALKQVAIFLVPVYLIWVWQEARDRRLAQACSAALAIAAVPLVVSLPFILWHAEAFFKSVLFSAMRHPVGHVPEAPSLDTALGLGGLAGRVPMVLMMGLVYVGAARRHLGRHVSVFLVMGVFTGFNPVLFRQYLCWVVPLVALCALDRGGPARRAAPAPEPGQRDSERIRYGLQA